MTTTFIDDIKSFVADNSPANVTVSLTGIDLFQIDTLAGVQSDLGKMDGTVLPLALIILALILGNFPLMLIPIVAILTTICAEFTIMYPIALCVQVVSFTPR